MLYLDSYFSTKVDDFDDLNPDSDLLFPLDITVGWSSEEGTTDYFLFVCNDRAFEKNKNLLKSEKYIIVGRRPHQEMIQKINSILAECNDNNSFSSYEKLSLFFKWEYTDYRIV